MVAANPNIDMEHPTYEIIERAPSLTLLQGQLPLHKDYIEHVRQITHEIELLKYMHIQK
jgi:hypothetical protein